MARKLPKSQINDIKESEDDEIESHPDELVSDLSESRGKPMSKAGAARAALAEGITVPKEASLHIKQKYGIDISPQQFSAEKSRLKLRASGVQPFSSSDPSSQNLDSFLASPPKRNAAGETDLIEAMEAMKPLIAQLGAAKVKRMVDLLG